MKDMEVLESWEKQMNEETQVERLVYAEYNEYELESGVSIGITGFEGLYGEQAKILVSVMDGEFDILEQYVFTVNKFLSEDGLHYFWHEQMIPFLSQEYHCRKLFFGEYELINIIDDGREDEEDA